MPNLRANELLLKIIDAFALAGWSATALDRQKPFLIRAASPDGRAITVRVFVWNCTHGGATRSADEFRIQATGQMPAVKKGEITLLLGWHEGYGVFAAWDIAKHAGQASASPSAQIQRSELERAHSQSFATAKNQHGEIVVAFRPEFLADYALSAQALHTRGIAMKDTSLLNDLPAISDRALASIANAERREIVSRIVRRFRASDFRRRVLTAYGYECAACGVQLNLIEAAHIEPVNQPGSTDETKNGIALCALHHAAFDTMLISFDERYRLSVSAARLKAMKVIGRDGGATEFKRALRPMISLPADRRDFPDPVYIRRGRKARGWEV